MNAVGILLAAGSAERMGFDKLTTPLCGRTAIERSADALIGGGVARLILTVSERTRSFIETLAFPVPHILVQGGATRRESVYHALRAAEGADVVCIHDAARCMTRPEDVRRCIESAAETGSGVAAAQATDTVLRRGADGAVHVVPRDETLLMQTPQCFRYNEILRAYEAGGVDATDDCTLYARAGHTPSFVLCTPDNFKLTAPSDWARAQRMLARYGTGYDTHRLVEGRKLILGGVEIPFEKGLLGHSDADVLTHAIMDALLGAAALGDIGALFPDTDPAYAGADSIVLLQRVVSLLQERGYAPAAVDATVIAQRPKLAPHVPHIRARLADALGLPNGSVSVKATTTEGMNDEGRGLCISAMAVATLQ